MCDINWLPPACPNWGSNLQPRYVPDPESNRNVLVYGATLHPRSQPARQKTVTFYWSSAIVVCLFILISFGVIRQLALAAHVSWLVNHLPSAAP